MAYPSNFLRLVASGTLHSLETFSFGLSLVPNFPTPGAVPTTVPAGIVTAFTTFMATAKGPSSAAKLTTIKLNEIDELGRYADTGNTVQHDYAAPGTGGVSAALYPPQISLAVSLRTARARGLAHAGRFYIPTPTTPISNTDGTISVADADQVRGSVVTLLNAINAAVPGYRVGVASKVGEGDFEIVTGVRVGRALDTIRSRRANLLEAYSATTALAA